MSEEFMTPIEMAKLARVSRMTIYNWLKAGKIKGYMLGGTSVRLKRSDVEEFLNTRYPQRKSDEEVA